MLHKSQRTNLNKTTKTLKLRFLHMNNDRKIQKKIVRSKTTSKTPKSMWTKTNNFFASHCTYGRCSKVLLHATDLKGF